MAKRDGITRIVSERTGAVSYKARFSFVGDDGRRKHRSKTFAQRNRAKAWLADRRHEVDRDAYSDPSPVTVAEVAERWLETVERSREPSTALQYRHMWTRHVEPELGARKIASIRATMIQGWYDALGKTYAGNTVAQVHKVVRGIFAHAVTDGVIASNPADGRRIPHDRVEVRATWTPEQVRAFSHHAETDDGAILFAVLLGTGMRIGEALALSWGDVDLDQRRANVHQTVQRTKSGLRIRPLPKTGYPRTIVLPSATVLALRRQLAIVEGKPNPRNLVFFGRGGAIIHAATPRRQFAILCDRLDLPDIELHGLRRTAVTTMAAANVNPGIAAAQMGHSVDTMLRHYARITAEMQSAAAEALDTALASENAPDTRHG